jgi:hypothetical protein
MGCFVPVLMGERAWPSLCSCRCSRVTLPADGRLTRQRDIGRSSRSRSLASTFEFLPTPTRAKDVPLAGRSDTGSRRSYTRVESGDMGRVCRVATTESPELARRGLGCSSFGSCANLPAACRNVLTASVAFIAEHQRCGDLDGGRDETRVWLTWLPWSPDRPPGECISPIGCRGWLPPVGRL